jgi:hypothetical protein
MKIPSLRLVPLAVIAGVALLTSTGTAPAQLNINIGGGGPPPPPPPPPEHRWHQPYAGAYWIHGHNEWRDGHWIYIGGYYAYPPYPGAVWIEGHVGHDGRWHPGHWRH